MTTICAKCVSLYIPSKNDPWWRWLCMKAPRAQELNYVTGETVADPPYSPCRYINKGDCEEYEEGPNVLTPKEAK